jgi:hypothetical protein
VLAQSLQHRQQPANLADATISKLEEIIANLRAVPVKVDINVQQVQESSSSELPVDVESKVRQTED